MIEGPRHIDVLCVGSSSFDLAFAVSHHPEADEKCSAHTMSRCGGGPAANAAVAVSRLGLKGAFCGYVGDDPFGDHILQEFRESGVSYETITRSSGPTPLSVILVKPDGARTVVHHRSEAARPRISASLVKENYAPQVILFDGHEPDLSRELIGFAKSNRIVTVLDAGSVRGGTTSLIELVDYVVASAMFARDFTGKTDNTEALLALRQASKCVVITLGERGLVWSRGADRGSLAAYPVEVVDTTGAGDAFHGAFAAGLAERMSWDKLLSFSSAVAALSCTKLGSRLSLPSRREVDSFLFCQPT